MYHGLKHKPGKNEERTENNERTVLAFSDHRKLPTEIFEQIRAKNQPCIARVHTPPLRISPEHEPSNAARTPALRKLDNTPVINDRQKQNVLQTTSMFVPHWGGVQTNGLHDLEHVHRIEEEVRRRALLDLKRRSVPCFPQ
ncbi:hypothetical protein EVAR_38082_1 [Eumeta japonica]|uniref:Uncharacterized protein n=1 Tax=Eumeta variegata TaxID=151549 RepID=A0A4C1W7H6_EUMVA|nr:hypothetical protein EVAR_38082_1 [Eumeta japonica]